MSALPIYVDLDDVLCETARAFIDLLAREFDRRVAFDDIRSFDLGVSFGLDAADLRRFFNLAHRPELLAELQPVPEAVATLTAWEGAGHEIAVVTGRPPATEDDSRQWLTRHGVPHGRLTFVDKYGREGIDGGPGAVSLDSLEPRAYRFAVEDSLSTARYLRDELDIPVLLLDRPWNRGPSDGITRCDGWPEIRRSVGNHLEHPATGD